MQPTFIFFPFFPVCFFCFAALLHGWFQASVCNIFIHTPLHSLHPFRQVIKLTLLSSLPLSPLPLLFCFLFYSGLWFPFISSPLPVLPFLTSEAFRHLFCSRKSSQPSPSAWLCTALLIGSREIIPVEQDVLDWNSPQSNKITHTSCTISSRKLYIHSFWLWSDTQLLLKWLY